MAESGGPREQRVPADHNDRPIEELNQDELLDLLSRRADAGEPYDDVKKALDQYRSQQVASGRIDPQRVLDSIDTSVLENRPVADLQAGSSDEADERRLVGREILDTKAEVARLASKLYERIRFLRDAESRDEFIRDVGRITEQMERLVGGFSIHEVDSRSVQDLEMLLADCSEAMRRLRNIRVVIDDLPSLEEHS